MAKTVRWHYTVVGTGHFPFDMLRYDQAWPEDSGLAMTERRYDEPQARERREQRLVGLNPPTAERWASFGWWVVPESVDRRTW